MLQVSKSKTDVSTQLKLLGGTKRPEQALSSGGAGTSVWKVLLINIVEPACMESGMNATKPGCALLRKSSAGSKLASSGVNISMPWHKELRGTGREPGTDVSDARGLDPDHATLKIGRVGSRCADCLVSKNTSTPAQSDGDATASTRLQPKSERSDPKRTTRRTGSGGPTSEGSGIATDAPGPATSQVIGGSPTQACECKDMGDSRCRESVAGGGLSTCAPRREMKKPGRVRLWANKGAPSRERSSAGDSGSSHVMVRAGGSSPAWARSKRDRARSKRPRPDIKTAGPAQKDFWRGKVLAKEPACGTGVKGPHQTDARVSNKEPVQIPSGRRSGEPGLEHRQTLRELPNLAIRIHCLLLSTFHSHERSACGGSTLITGCCGCTCTRA